MKTALPLLTALYLAAASAVSACGFHNSDPVPSVVSRMIASDHIVLARSDPENRFRYMAIASIKGDTGAAEIPALVDSATMRRLRQDQNDSVLFARSAVDGSWERLAYIGPELRPILERITLELSGWEGAHEKERYSYFAGLLDHPDPGVRAFALRELEEAGYNLLRAVVTEVDVDDILQRLDRPSEFNLKAIRLLLLGLSDDGRAAQRLEAGLSTNLRYGGRQLGAYATAYLEINGPHSVDGFVRDYLGQGGIPASARELLVEALALNGTYGTTAMQMAVARALGPELGSDAGLATMAARQFGLRNNWSLAEPIANALRSGPDSPSDAIVLAQYLALADAEMAPLSQGMRFP